MDIAVLGTGRVGSALGIRWAQKGHRVFYGVRDPQSEEFQSLLDRSGPNAAVMSVQDAAAAGQAVLLAIPWDVTREVLDSLGPLNDKILIDCINPLTGNLKGLQLGFATSAAEQIAQWAPTATVVKAFNTVSDATMVNPWYRDQPATMFYCGDDEAAKAVIRQLTEDLELEPVDAGPLVNARQLEPLAALYVYLAIFGGWGGDCAFKIVKR
ncbi:MAG: NADPH-dependent F420 reductase [Pirellulaceae bacterium]|nr:NADPH-dependent F420 reductase [Pirellulaceae bacterium]